MKIPQRWVEWVGLGVVHLPCVRMPLLETEKVEFCWKLRAFNSAYLSNSSPLLKYCLNKPPTHFWLGVVVVIRATPVYDCLHHPSRRIFWNIALFRSSPLLEPCYLPILTLFTFRQLIFLQFHLKFSALLSLSFSYCDPLLPSASPVIGTLSLVPVTLSPVVIIELQSQLCASFCLHWSLPEFVHVTVSLSNLWCCSACSDCRTIWVCCSTIIKVNIFITVSVRLSYYGLAEVWYIRPTCSPQVLGDSHRILLPRV